MDGKQSRRTWSWWQNSFICIWRSYRYETSYMYISLRHVFLATMNNGFEKSINISGPFLRKQEHLMELSCQPLFKASKLFEYFDFWQTWYDYSEWFYSLWMCVCYKVSWWAHWTMIRMGYRHWECFMRWQLTYIEKVNNSISNLTSYTTSKF